MLCKTKIGKEGWDMLFVKMQVMNKGREYRGELGPGTALSSLKCLWTAGLGRVQAASRDSFLEVVPVVLPLFLSTFCE